MNNENDWIPDPEPEDFETEVKIPELDPEPEDYDETKDPNWFADLRISIWSREDDVKIPDGMEFLIKAYYADACDCDFFMFQEQAAKDILELEQILRDVISKIEHTSLIIHGIGDDGPLAELAKKLGLHKLKDE